MTNGAMHKQLIRVVYPTDGGRIALRMEGNWDSNIEARSIGQNGYASEFWMQTERPYFYFKPVLLREDSVQWSRGKNFLAVATSGVRGVSFSQFIANGLHAEY